jgi:hypothetical protein
MIAGMGSSGTPGRAGGACAQGRSGTIVMNAAPKRNTNHTLCFGPSRKHFVSAR